MSVPMQFPSTMFPVVPEPQSATPLALLPEMMFTAPANVPPIVLPDVPE